MCIKNDSLAKQNVSQVSRGKALPARHSWKLVVTNLSWLFAFQSYAGYMLHFAGSLFARTTLVFNMPWVSTNGPGHLGQGQSSEDSRKGNSPILSGTDKNLGMVRGRVGISTKASLSHNSSKYPNQRSSFGSQGMESHTEPVAEIPHKHSGDF